MTNKERFLSILRENVHRDGVEKLIDYLTERYGGVVEYLRFIGVPESIMDRIREKLVE